MNRNISIGLVVITAIAAAGFLYYWFATQREVVPPPPALPEITPLEEEKGLGRELFEKSGNPAQKVPETNPFKNVQTNPLQSTNPFEGGYRNPFGG